MRALSPHVGSNLNVSLSCIVLIRYFLPYGTFSLRAAQDCATFLFLKMTAYAGGFERTRVCRWEFPSVKECSDGRNAYILKWKCFSRSHFPSVRAT